MTTLNPAPGRESKLELLSMAGHPLQVGVDERSFLVLGRRCHPLPSLPTLVVAFFTPQEWLQLNPGHYHDPHHPVHVARMLAEVAYNRGRSRERSLFLQKVALLHDADDRINLKTGTRLPVSPARVQVTLEWMERNREALCLRLGWDSIDFLEAQALIARTDFPFDHQPRHFGTRYDGKSPRQLYGELLRLLPPECWESTMQDALLLRFADQAGNYCASEEQSRYYLQGLADELQQVGIPATFESIAQSSPGFIASIGTDLEEDELLAQELSLPHPLPGRDDLLAGLSQPRLDALRRLEGQVLN